jgi:hypothetical protein
MAALRLKNGDDATFNPRHLLSGRFAKRPDTPWNSRPSTCQTGRFYYWLVRARRTPRPNQRKVKRVAPSAMIVAVLGGVQIYSLFDDHGQPKVAIPLNCPVTIAEPSGNTDPPWPTSYPVLPALAAHATCAFTL